MSTIYSDSDNYVNQVGLTLLEVRQSFLHIMMNLKNSTTFNTCYREASMAIDNIHKFMKDYVLILGTGQHRMLDP
jgi:hypothetical protein